MPDARLPCPACLGLPMHKARFEQHHLELDVCRRCGGIWFDAGEVESLSRVHPNLAETEIKLKPEAHLMACHRCSSSMDRNADRCPACNWENRLDCPVCQRKMSIARVGDLKLDYCKHDKGVWFDNVELASIWNRHLTGMLGQRDKVWLDGEDAADFFVGMLYYSPDLVWYGGEAVVETIVHAPDIAAGALDLVTHTPDLAAGAVEAVSHLPDLAGSAVEMVAHAPDVAGVVVEGVGAAAGGVFEAIGEIIGGIFGGIFDL